VKFNRQYSLLIELPDEEQIEIKPPFTLQLSIARDNKPSSNKGTFSVYNLGELNRRKIFQDRYDKTYRRIQLKAGYGDDIGIVFSGNLREAYSFRRKNDYITYMDCMDGGIDYRESFSAFNVKKEEPKNNIVDRLLNDLTHTKRGVVSKSDDSSARGKVVIGNTAQQLSKETDGDFYIDNELAYVLGTNEFVEGEVIVINAANGLLSTPKRADKVITVEMLFDPRVFVGQIVELESIAEPNLNAQYKVVSIKHSGIISDAVSGQLKTVLDLWIGEQKLIGVTKDGD